jgi:plastocyanin
VRRSLLSLAVLVLAATACSKSSVSDLASSSPRTSPSAAPAKAPVTLPGKVNNHGTKDLTAAGMTVSLEIEQDNFYFAPTFVKTKPGAKVTVKLKNEGTAPHTFTVDSARVDETLKPDQTRNVAATLPSSGVVTFYCKFHRAQGMQGAFYFGATAAATPRPSTASAPTNPAAARPAATAPPGGATTEPKQPAAGDDETPEPSSPGVTPYIPYPGGPGY